MTGNKPRAEELTQDVFVRAWEKLTQFRGDSAFSTWLHKLTVNVVLNDIKSERRQIHRFGTDVIEPDSLSRGPKHVGEMVDIETAIAALPPGARRVFVLHDVEGYKHEDIGEMLGITAGGSKAQLHRARMMLREALNK